MESRRDLLKMIGGAVLAVAGKSRVDGAEGAFELPPLPYSYDALEPHISARTMQLHHGAHHAAYVRNLNAAVAKYPELAKRAAEDLVRNWKSLPEDIRTTVRNNGGGHVNHALFWQIMSPKGGGQPTGELARAIEKTFGTFSKFQDEFTRTALGVFGSGWAWLTVDPKTKALRIEPTPNQDNPITEGRVPILGVDVWEHAYYLDYQNRRPDYVRAWYNVVNWDRVTELYLEALRS